MNSRFWVAVLASLLVVSGLTAQPAGAHTIDPGPSPILEDHWVFCAPGKPLHLAVHTIPGAAYAVWTYNYNPSLALTPALGYFTDFAGLIIAGRDPDLSVIYPGQTIPQPPGVKDEILLVFVYGLAYANPRYRGANEPLIDLTATHCEP